ncbi:hypothetical protein E2C01_094822 [Portunus trituberculatus]|uniref:Secreted protein n=1 Tax=Portunus trituberculatus TaxID=210409 RepID=A0A5B7JX63_PORTR|nr:hypothetical protein [Portunus trituberculatus]
MYGCKMNTLWLWCFIVLRVEEGEARRDQARRGGPGLEASGRRVGWCFLCADAKGSDLVPPRCPRLPVLPASLAL